MPKLMFQAVFNAGRVAAYRNRVNKQTGTAVRERLERIRDNWAADVRVDTRHYQETIEKTEPVMTSPTAGYIRPEPFEVYFAANEYGGPTISPRPSMRQAIEKERANLNRDIDAILRDIL